MWFLLEKYEWVETMGAIKSPICLRVAMVFYINFIGYFCEPMIYNARWLELLYGSCEYNFFAVKNQRQVLCMLDKVESALYAFEFEDLSSLE